MNTLKNLLLEFFPPLCVHCKSLSGDYLCENCKEKLLHKSLKISKITQNMYSFTTYENQIKSLFQHIKFNELNQLIGYLDAFLTVNYVHIHSIIKDYEYWTTVPYHKKKLKQRNVDLVKSLFENIMKKNNIQYISLFERSKHTKPLYNLPVEQRKKTIQGCFNVITKNVSTIKNKKLLIVDDIITTGTTINEIKKSLSSHLNDENVQYIKFARSINSHDINFNLK